MTRYVIIPRDLARELHEPLRHHYASDPSVQVIVERRGVDEEEGAHVLPRAGRRGGDRSRSAGARRMVVSTSETGSLPPEAAPLAHRLRFLRGIDVGAADVADRHSFELVVRFQQGDPVAFNALYRRHFDYVYGFLRMGLADGHLAEDVTQEVFLRAHAALPGFEVRPQVPFRSWLRRIAQNEMARALSRRGVGIEPCDPSELDSAEGRSDRSFGERAFIDACEQLPAREQQAFVLRHGFGMSVAEAATVMSTSQDAVKSLAKRARARLRQELEELGRTPAESAANRMAMRRRLRPSPVLSRRSMALRSPGH